MNSNNHIFVLKLIINDAFNQLPNDPNYLNEHSRMVVCISIKSI